MTGMTSRTLASDICHVLPLAERWILLILEVEDS